MPMGSRGPRLSKQPNHSRIVASTCSTINSGHRSPTSVFKILKKYRKSQLRRITDATCWCPALPTMPVCANLRLYTLVVRWASVKRGNLQDVESKSYRIRHDRRGRDRSFWGGICLPGHQQTRSSVRGGCLSHCRSETRQISWQSTSQLPQQLQQTLEP